MIRPVRLAPLVLFALVLAASCTGFDNVVPPEDPKIDADVDFSGGRVIVFMIDALGQDKFDEMLDTGRLPNIKRYIVDRGVMVRPNVTSVPTITYACFPAALTGHFPGHTGVPANNWFDRRTYVHRDYGRAKYRRLIQTDVEPTYIYEHLPNDWTTAVHSYLHRGENREHESTFTLGPAFWFGNFRLIDRVTTARFYVVLAEANKLKDWPALLVLYYYSGDAIMHRTGRSSPETHSAFEQIDVHVGEVCEVLARNGRLDQVLLVLFADHGAHDQEPGQTIDPAGQLNRLGIATTREFMNEDNSEAKRRAFFERFRGVCSVIGNRTCFLYLRKPGAGWEARPTGKTLRNYAVVPGFEVDLPGFFAKNPAVDVVVWREGKDTIGVLSGQGEARITRREVRADKLYAYRVVEGRDPLGYADASDADLRRLAVEGEYSSLRWLEATVNTERPDVVPQLVELFDNPRIGDLVLLAAPGWAFTGINETVAHHGGLTRGELLTPLVFAGPGAERMSRGPSRAVNITPTILDYLNRTSDKPMTFDGRSLYKRD